jgi:hypothetical protein
MAIRVTGKINTFIKTTKDSLDLNQYRPIKNPNNMNANLRKPSIPAAKEGIFGWNIHRKPSEIKTRTSRSINPILGFSLSRTLKVMNRIRQIITKSMIKGKYLIPVIDLINPFSRARRSNPGITRFRRFVIFSICGLLYR